MEGLNKSRRIARDLTKIIDSVLDHIFKVKEQFNHY